LRIGPGLLPGGTIIEKVMIAGLGMDMIEVERVAAKIGREAGFREMVFSPKEIAYCEQKADKFVHYAGRWAAKEAFFKAMGTGWSEGTAFHEIEITNDEAGKPEIRLLGETARTVGNASRILVSISHLKELASAVVIIER
jgi:holo-[acyl-carrier protein] synthase